MSGGAASSYTPFSGQQGIGYSERSGQRGFTSLRGSAQQGFTPFGRSAQQGFESFERSAENGFTSFEGSAQQGFTLIELLVALMIFAMLAAAGVLLLGNAVSAQGAVARHLDEQGAMTRIVALLDQDMARAVPRISRTETGLLAPAFFSRAPSDREPFLQFVRGGWSNMDDAPRPSVQKVEYWLREGRLERRGYPMVDGAQGDEPVMLLEDVRALSLAFRDRNGEWVEEWQQTRPLAMPTAMRMVMTRADRPPLTLLFRVSGGIQAEEEGQGDAGG
ncbi:MAG: type II secretion system minor pseudopilin GspJ [Sphingobium sp.]